MSTKCLINECARPSTANTRGLCLTCYSKAKEMVSTGKTTWERLYDLGLVLDNRSDAFTSAYDKAMEEDDADSK